MLRLIPALAGALLLAGLASPALGQADSGEQPAVVLSDSERFIPLGDKVYVLEDPTGQMTVDEVASPQFARQFQPSGDEIPNFGFTDSAIWLRLRLRNDSRLIDDWRLESSATSLDELSFFHRKAAGPGFVEHATGAAYPFNSRDIPTPTFTFDVPLAYGMEQDFYIRAKSGNTVAVPLAIMSIDQFAANRGRFDLLFGLVYGTLAAMTCTFLLMFTQLKDRLYLALSVMTAGALVLMLAADGNGARFMWRDVPILSMALAYVSFSLLAIGLGFFVSEAIDAHRNSPRLYRALAGLSAALLLATGLLLLPSRYWSAMVQNALVLLIMGVAIAEAWIAVKRGVRAARLVLFALLALVPMVLMTVMAILDVLPETPLTVVIVIVCGAFSLIMVARIVADRTRQIQDERRSAIRALALQRARFARILDDQPRGIVRLNAQGGLTYANQAAAVFSAATPEALIGRSDFSATTPEGRERINEAMMSLRPDAPLRTILAPAIRYDGAERMKRLVIRGYFDDQGRVIESQITTEDLTEAIRAEKELADRRAELEHLVEQRTADLRREEAAARGLSAMSAVLSSSLDLDTVARAILEQANHVSGVEGVALLVREGDELVTLAASGVGSEVKGVRYMLNDDSKATVRAYHAAVPVIFDDTHATEGWPHTPGVYVVRSLLLLPLRNQDGVLGLLGVGSHEPHAFDDEAITLLTAYAEHAALAVTNARLFQSGREAAARAERERLARDLHDSVTQSLFSASILAEAARPLFAQDPAGGLAVVEKLRQLTRGALGEMRALLVELRPSVLVDAELGTLMRYLVDAAVSRSGMAISLEVSGERVALPEDAHIIYYRIAQEALNNVTKHSQATAAKVHLQYSRDGVALIIQDNGRGFNQENGGRGGLGLGIMRERAAEAGAELTIASMPGQGTTVRLSAPLDLDD